MGWHFGKKTWRHHHTNFNGYPRGYLIQHGATSLSLSTNYQIFYITVHTMQVAMLSYLSYLTCHPRSHATHLKKWVWPVFQIFLRPLTKPLLPYNADWNEPWLGPICLDMSPIIHHPMWPTLGKIARWPTFQIFYGKWLNDRPSHSYGNWRTHSGTMVCSISFRSVAYLLRPK